MQRVFSFVMLGAVLILLTACATAPTPVLPASAQWGDFPLLPGVKIATLDGNPSQPGPFIYRLSFPANSKVPPHYHPIAENVTVISGTVNLGHGDTLDAAKTTKYPAGSFFTVPATMHHYAWTDQETVVQVHGTGPTSITFVNPADDPRKK